MGALFDQLDRDWEALATSRALTRATRDVLALAANADDWVGAQEWMRSPFVPRSDKERVIRSLVHRAASDGDELAARVALAIVTPGIVCELARHRRRPAAPRMSNDELESTAVAIVWNLICQYPTHREGSVAANLLLDLRKALCKRPTSVVAIPVDNGELNNRPAPEADDAPNDVSVLVDLACRARRLDRDQADIILDTSVRGVPCKDAAALRRMSLRTFRRRQRAAEARLASHARQELAA